MALDYKHKTKGTIRPIRDHILVEEMEFKERKTRAGIILLDDDATSAGIRPRWAKVNALGPEADEDIKVGNWVLVNHGRWTRGVQVEDVTGNVKTIRRVDENDILLVTDEQPMDETVGYDNSNLYVDNLNR